MKESRLYRILRPIITGLFKFIYRPTIIGKENIPKKGRIVLAGNHTNNLDCVLLISSTKRSIHFLAKKELFEGKMAFVFKRMNIIPVDRVNKQHNALGESEEVLNHDGMIGIFPESTFNRTKDIIMPFKIGAVKMAYHCKSKIVPFAIVGNYKAFKKGIKIVFLEPYKVENSNLDQENEKLMKIVSDLLIKERKNI